MRARQRQGADDDMRGIAAEEVVDLVVALPQFGQRQLGALRQQCAAGVSEMPSCALSNSFRPDSRSRLRAARWIDGCDMPILRAAIEKLFASDTATSARNCAAVSSLSKSVKPRPFCR
jgi:hypothetical protein